MVNLRIRRIVRVCTVLYGMCGMCGMCGTTYDKLERLCLCFNEFLIEFSAIGEYYLKQKNMQIGYV